MKKKVVKTKLKQKQVQSQKQIVNINIGDKSKRKRRASKRPNKKSLLPVGPTIIMNTHNPQQPPSTPMERPEPVHTIMPSTLPKQPKPLTPTYVPEYVGTDYLADDERVIDPMRTARLTRFFNEPLSRVENIENVSDIGTPDISVTSNNILRTELFDIPPPQPESGGAVFNQPNQDVIQLSELDLINQSEEPTIENAVVSGGGAVRGAEARLVRQALQNSEGVGAEVPDDLLLQGKYNLSGNNRRTVPTMNQRYRLFALGKPYKGDEKGVVIGRKQKKDKK